MASTFKSGDNEVSHRIASTLNHKNPLITRSSRDNEVFSEVVVLQMTSLSDVHQKAKFFIKAIT